MSDMTQSFIEMVEAFKAKPALEAEVSRLSEDNALCYQTIDLKNSIIASRDEELATLRAELAEVRKREEDASFRNLELEDKLGGIEKLLGLAERLEQARRDEHQATVDAMTPKPDPIVVQGQSAVGPMPVGQPESDTTTSKDGAETPPPSDRPINPYTSFPIHYPDGEYKGQPYYDKPSWVSWAAWCDAGGEAEPYMKNFG